MFDVQPKYEVKFGLKHAAGCEHRGDVRGAADGKMMSE